MDTQKFDSNKGQENTENKKKDELNETGLLMGAGGIIAAGVVASQLSKGDEETPEEGTQSDGTEPVGEASHPQTQAQPSHQEEEPVVETPQTEQLANANEPTPIAPDRPGIPDSQTSSNTTDDLLADVETLNPDEEELIAVAEHIVNDPVNDDQELAVVEVTMDDIVYTENGDELAMNDHNVEDNLYADTEVLNDSDAVSELDNIPVEEVTEIDDIIFTDDSTADLGMPDYEAPEDILADSDGIDDILADISYEAPDE
ncbi:MAG: hypothetical protein IKP43_03545 [Bacteroidaceae bacterium]|nr:hypothetical protein [Bacteroidaceae bacterium]